MKYDNLSKDELVTRIEELEHDLINYKKNNERLTNAEDLAKQQRSILKLLKSMAIPSADKSSVDEFSKILLKAVKEYTGAVLASFSYYHSDKKELNILHVETEQKVWKTVLKIAGEKIVKTPSPVDDKTYKLIIKEIVGAFNNFTEVSFGAIPRFIDKAIRASTGIDRLYPIAHVIEGELYGTTMLAFKKGQASPSMELLESYAHLISVSLRRYNAEKALQDSEIKYKTYIENSPLGILIANDKGKYIDVNPAAAELLGYTPDELLKLSIPDVLAHEKDLDSFQQLKEKGKLSFEKKLKKKDGTVVIVRLDAIHLPNNRFIAFHTDITKRKQAEKTLKESEHRFRSMFEKHAAAMLLIEPESGKIIDSNISAAQFYGYSRKELNSINIEDINTSNPKKVRKYREQAEAEGINTFYFKHRLKNQTIRDVQVHSTPIEYINQKLLFSIILDITERKQAEKELLKAKENAEASKEKFKLLNRLNSEMLLLKDLESMYKFIAENLQKHYPNTIILNSSIDESIQQSRLEIILGLDNNLLKKAIKILGVNPIGRTYKLTDIHKNYFKSGEFIEFDGGLAEFSASELPAFAATTIEKLIGLHKIYTIGINKDDGLLAAIHFFTFKKQDITDGHFIELFVKQAGLVLQKKIDEKALKIAKEKAEESDRLKSAFLTNMSHEIRTPMNGILGFTNLLKKPGLTGEDQQKFIEIIEKSGNRMLITINDIIDISRIEAGQVDIIISDINLNKQMDELLEFFLPEAKKKNIRLSITSRVPAQQAKFKSDKEKLISILTNFIKNAIKYTHAGSIDFGCSIKERGEQSELEFYVKDTGIGIPKDRQNAVFGRFVQADIEDRQVYEGSGLGLAISTAYVEMLGGKIWLESEEGVGSTFCFTIPYNTSNKETPKKNMVDSNKQRVVKKGLKVLIADDDEVSLAYLSIVLNEIAKEKLIAKTGIEAVEMCRNNPDIDIVLMDIKIPGIDGYEATRQIREFNKDVFILAQTAYAQSGDREESIQAGCNEYISKPIKKERLLELISNRF